MPSVTQLAQDTLQLLLLLLLSLSAACDYSLITDSILKTCDMIKVVVMD